MKLCFYFFEKERATVMMSVIISIWVPTPAAFCIEKTNSDPQTPLPNK